MAQLSSSCWTWNWYVIYHVVVNFKDKEELRLTVGVRTVGPISGELQFKLQFEFIWIHRLKVATKHVSYSKQNTQGQQSHLGTQFVPWFLSGTRSCPANRVRVIIEVSVHSPLPLNTRFIPVFSSFLFLDFLGLNDFQDSLTRSTLRWEEALMQTYFWGGERSRGISATLTRSYQLWLVLNGVQEMLVCSAFWRVLLSTV